MDSADFEHFLHTFSSFFKFFSRHFAWLYRLPLQQCLLSSNFHFIISYHLKGIISYSYLVWLNRNSSNFCSLKILQCDDSTRFLCQLKASESFSIWVRVTNHNNHFLFPSSVCLSHRIVWWWIFFLFQITIFQSLRYLFCFALHSWLMLYRQVHTCVLETGNTFHYF